VLNQNSAIIRPSLNMQAMSFLRYDQALLFTLMPNGLLLSADALGRNVISRVAFRDSGSKRRKGD